MSEPTPHLPLDPELADGTAALRSLLRDGFERVHDRVGGVLDGCPSDALTFRVDDDANTIAWLVWHLSRVQDDHVAGLAGTDQAWHADGWQARFGLDLDADDTGYGHSAQQVAALDAVSADQLTGYHEAVDARTEAYLDRVDVRELARVVDEHWDPPVTASVRLVSVLSDTLQHVGQAALLRGIAERAPS